MDQEKVWDMIAVPWSEFRSRVPVTVEKFLSDKKGRILDVGCGSGRNFIKIDGLKWSGVDFSEVMLGYSRKDAEKKGMDVELKRAGVDGLPFEDETFDSVLCYAALHCVDGAEQRKKGVEEIHRVLKSGSEALISSWGIKAPRLKNKKKECFIPWSSRVGDAVKRYTYVYDLDELVDLCKEAGFEIVSAWEDRNVNVIVRKS